MRIKFDKLIVQYVKDRDEVMLAYPDTKKLDDLLIKYRYLYTPEYHERWSKASAEVKTRTIELMIASWSEAPLWLKEKVRQAQEARREK